MARCGRKPRAEAAIDDLDGSPRAKQRLAIILKATRGEITVPEACSRLGIGESRFHDLRNRWLQHSLGFFEPRPMGRPPKASVSAEQVEAYQLQERIDLLTEQLAAAEVRRHLAEVMPHVLHPDAAEKGGSIRPCQLPR